MRRATVNFWVDAVIAVAFLVSGFSGILFLLPVSWRSVSEAGGAVMLGLSIQSWHTLHDWSGIIAAVGVVVHGALHLRWFVNMARRMARGEDRADRWTATRPAARPLPAARSVIATSSDLTPVRLYHAGGSGPAARAAVVETTSDGGDDRFSRRAFVAGLGTAVGTAAVLGVGALLRSDSSSAAGVQFADSQSGETDPSQAQSGNGSQGGWGSGSTQNDGSGSTGSTSSTARVVVDSAACVGCGRCLDVCPYGIFAWNGVVAAAQNPDACRLCGHCVQVCPAGAITLNG